MSDTTRHSARPEPTQPSWREWYRVALFGLSAYSTGIAWQAQLVSYPLYRSVGAADFAAYHLDYNAAIPFVVIVPGFVTFLAAMGYWWTGPRDESRAVAGTVAVSGLAALSATLAWAIPRHDELDRVGQSMAVIDSLLQANLLRSLVLTAGTVALGWALGRRLTRSSATVPQPDVATAPR